MGKGSKMRPSQVERKVFEDNWDRCFKKVQKELTELNADGNEGAWVASSVPMKPFEPGDRIFGDSEDEAEVGGVWRDRDNNFYVKVDEIL